MALPGNVNKVRVRGYWWDDDGTGYAAGTVTFSPLVPDLTDMAAFGNITPEPATIHPDPTTGYYFADLIATNDPDLTAFAWRITRTKASGVVVLDAIIAVPYDAPTVDVGAGLMKQSLWLVDAATTTAPPVGPVFYTAAATDAAIATAIGSLSGGPVGDATTLGKGIVRLAGDLGGTAANPTVPALTTHATTLTAHTAELADHDTQLDVDAAALTTHTVQIGEHYGYLVQEVVDRQVADGQLEYEIGRRYEFDPAVGIPEADLSDGVVTKLNTVGSGGGSSSAASGPTSRLSLGDRHVAEDAGIAESKVALAADAHVATPSRRTLGFGARQAMPGNTHIPLEGVDVPPLVDNIVPASFLPDGSVAGAPLDTATKPSPLGIPAAGTNVRSSPADHIHPRPGTAHPADHGLLVWSFDPANAGSSATVTAGVLQLVRLWIPQPMTITGIVLSAVTGGVSLTNCFTALFDSNKNLLSQSANRASAWGATAGDKKGDLATPQVIATPGYVYAGWWNGGGTSPGWARASAITGGSANNLNLPGAALRFSTANIGLTTTAPATASAQTALVSSFLVGLY